MNQEREAVARLIEQHIESVCSDGNADPRRIAEPLADAILALRSGGEGWQDISTGGDDAAKD